MTDFACASKPSLPTCSLADLTALSPGDIVTKLKTLFQIVIILFGLMNTGSVVGVALDSRERRNFLQRMKAPEVGFRLAPSGTWLWCFSLEPLRGELDAPTGPAVALSALLGIPVVRLRAALPDELLTWDLATALGRKHVCSPAGFNSSLTAIQDLLPPLLGGSRPLKAGRSSAASQTGSSSRKSSRQGDLMEEFVGTALMLAFIQVAQLLPVRELAARVSAASTHFAGANSPAGRDFGSTQTDFVTLLSPGVLNGERKWLQRARLFKLILSQHGDGSWDVSSTTAFALEARPAVETKLLPRDLKSCLSDLFAASAEASEDVGDADVLHTSDHDSPSAADDIGLGDARQSTEEDVPVHDAHPHLTDCPVTCPKEALVDCMPRALRSLKLAAQPTRVWCTMCCIAVLERMNVCWIAGDGDVYEPQEKTIVDSAHEWIAAMADAHPALAAALEDGTVLKAAYRATALWHRAFEQRVGDLRRAEAVRAQLSRSHVHRAFTNLTRAVATKHSTLAVFLSEPLDGLQRWQMFMIIVTLVFSQLLVNIWMFYAKAVNCCAQVVSLLDSGPDGGNCPAAGSCRGFNGTCADIVQQFTDVPILPDYPAGMADYTCDAFPMDSKPVDSFVVALISIAINVPVVLFLRTCFGIANDSEAPESWLEWSGWRRFVFGFDAHRQWHYTGPAGQPNRHVRWFLRSVGAPPSETVINLGHSAVAFATCSDPPWTVEAREAAQAAAEESEVALHADAEYGSSSACETRPSDERSRTGSLLVDIALEDGTQPNLQRHSGVSSDGNSAAAEARELARYKRAMAAAGLVGVYICWAVFSWCVPCDASAAARSQEPRFCRFVFTYGMLIYKLLGEQAEHDLARSWGVSYGIGAVAEWKVRPCLVQKPFRSGREPNHGATVQDILQEALRGAVVVVILERLYLTRSVFWLEDHLDYHCLQAIIFGNTALGFTAQIGVFWQSTRRLA